MGGGAWGHIKTVKRGGSFQATLISAHIQTFSSTQLLRRKKDEFKLGKKH
jgi:hypothetical protein